jgi:hypothetical protein
MNKYIAEYRSCYCLPCSVCHTHASTLTRSHTIPHSLAHSLTHSLARTRSLTHSPAHGPSLTRSHTLPHSLAHSLPPSLTHTHTRAHAHTHINIYRSQKSPQASEESTGSYPKNIEEQAVVRNRS